MPVPSPSSTTYSRDFGDLPPGDAYAVSAGRLAGAALGYPDTEAVMQQGQWTDEDQRALQADDIATLRMGMTGLDRVAGSLDDYTFRLAYNPDYHWHFNPTPNPECSAADDELSFSNATKAGVAYHEACNSIVYDSGFVIESGAEVTAIAPIVSLRAGTRINGAFRVVSVFP